MAGPNRNLKDQDVIKLLSRLKTSEAKYPPDLLSKRRAGFMAGIAALLGGSVAGGGGGGAGGTASAAGSGGHAGTAMAGMSQVDKLIIALEVVVLTGMTSYLGVTAYENRDYLKSLLFPTTPTVAQAAPPVFPLSTESTASLLPTIGTPTPTGTLDTTMTAAETDESASQPEETPQPDNTVPGLHLGQTKNPPTKAPPQKP